MSSLRFQSEPNSVSGIHKRSRDDLSNAKLFADDTSLFSVVHNVNILAGEVNNDLVKINECAYQWKMSFNADPIKQAREIMFTRKKN